MSTAAEQEAERRWPVLKAGVFWSDVRNRWDVVQRRADFVSGAAFERERIRELLEAAEAYRDGGREYDVAWAELQAHFNDPAYADAVQRAYWKRESGEERLLAAAAALPGGTDG